MSVLMTALTAGDHQMMVMMDGVSAEWHCSCGSAWSGRGHGRDRPSEMRLAKVVAPAAILHAAWHRRQPETITAPPYPGLAAFQCIETSHPTNAVRGCSECADEKVAPHVRHWATLDPDSGAR